MSAATMGTSPRKEGAPVGSGEPLPLAGAGVRLDELLEAGDAALRLWAPAFVGLDRGDAPWLTVGAAGRPDELARLALDRRAFAVAVDVRGGAARVVRGALREGASPRLPPAPGFEGGLGPAPGPREAVVAGFAMWDRRAPWPAGTYAVVAMAANRASARAELVVGRAATTVDPAADSVDPESLRVWPPPDPAGNLPHYRPLPDSPPVPAEPGITLVAPRVAPGGTAVIHASFRARLRPPWLVQYGAVVPLTLVLTGSEDPVPIVLSLRIPSFDRIESGEPGPDHHGALRPRPDAARAAGHRTADLVPPRHHAGRGGGAVGHCRPGERKGHAMNRTSSLVVETLWSTGEQVYAVLDGARDERTFFMVRASGLPYACLYAGAIPRELAEVAPYLVALERDHPFVEELLEDAWGQSWGIFATGRCDLEPLRRHLRHFMRARREDGKTLVFRYYDPRVLRLYLPTCTDGELTTFFGPLSRFVMEDVDASRVVTFSRSAGAWSTSKVALPSRSEHVAVETPREM